MTPVSETELTFSIPSDDNGSDSGRSGSGLSAKLSLLSLRAVANGAIGSERKSILLGVVRGVSGLSSLRGCSSVAAM